MQQKAWIRVGGGTSGQAIGADSVFDSFKSTVESTGANANVSMVGAMGLMYMEPQVDILMPDGVRVFYGNVQPSEAEGIVGQHVKTENLSPTGRLHTAVVMVRRRVHYRNWTAFQPSLSKKELPPEISAKLTLTIFCNI